MKELLTIGKHGAERIGELTQPAADTQTPVDPFLDMLKKMPTTKHTVERDDGVKSTVEVTPLPLKSRRIRELVYVLAAYEPTVFARVGECYVQGMLSANYDAHGENRLPEIKIIPLRQPLEHTSTGLPDAGGVAMLGGAVSLERPGVGGHSANTSQDVDHRASVYGAISLQKPSLALTHQQHGVRKTGSSVATGLTNGTLGNLYTPTSRADTFQGFGGPVIVDEQNAAEATIFLPRPYLDNPESAFGALLPVDSTRVMLGAGVMRLINQRGEGVLADVAELAGRVA